MFSEALEIFDFLEIREVIIAYTSKEHKQHTVAMQNAFPMCLLFSNISPRSLEKQKELIQWTSSYSVKKV